MPVRTFVTTGVAFATAGMIAVVPAIAPPLAPRDAQIVRDTQVELTLTIQDLINVFWGVDPEPDAPVLPSVDPDNPGTFGASGVVYQLLYAAANGNLAAQSLVRAFFTGGVSEVVRQILLATSPPAAAPFIDAFFDNGVSGLIHEYLTTAAPDDTYLNIFFNIDNPLAGDESSDNPSLFGVSGVVYQYLIDAGAATGTDPGTGTPFDDLFQGGATQVVWHQVTNGIGGEDPFVNSFFNINNPNVDPENPSQFGVSGVVYRYLIESGAAKNVGDPETGTSADNFFNGGVAEVAQGNLLKLATTQQQKDLINEYFDSNGIFGVVRYLLAGPAPEDNPAIPNSARVPEQQTPVENEPDLQINAMSGEESELRKGPEVKENGGAARGGISPLSVRVNNITPAAALPGGSAPTPATLPVITPPPVKLPVVETPPAAGLPAAQIDPPKFTSKIREKSVKEEKAPAEDLGANKVEPVIIVGEGGPKPGTGSWGILGDIAKTVRGALNPQKPASAPDADGAADKKGGGGQG